MDLLVATFGAQDGQIPGYPGHPEIELALLRLYKLTGEPKHLKLAQFFIEERGNPHGGKEKRHYYDMEAEARGENEHMLPAYFPAARSYWYEYDSNQRADFTRLDHANSLKVSTSP